MLASPRSGSSSASRLRIVTFGQTTSTTSEKRGVAPVVDLVQDAPGGEHPHHGRLARAGRHLAGVAAEGVDALGLASGGSVDPLQEIGARLGQEDDRLGRFELGEEEPAAPALAPPVWISSSVVA